MLFFSYCPVVWYLLWMFTIFSVFCFTNCVQNLEMDLSNLADTIQDIISQGKEMADAGHFNKAGILSAVQNFNKRYWRVFLTFSQAHCD